MAAIAKSRQGSADFMKSTLIIELASARQTEHRMGKSYGPVKLVPASLVARNPEEKVEC
jgi:hypothetical protein